MMSLADLIKKRKSLEIKLHKLAEREDELNFRSRIANEKNDKRLIHDAVIETRVVSSMVEEISDHIKYLDNRIAFEKDRHTENEKKFGMYSATAAIIAFLCFFIPDFSLALIWFLSFISFSIYFGWHSNKEKELASGLSENELNMLRAIAEKEERDRNSLAISIANEIEKKFKK